MSDDQRSSRRDQAAEIAKRIAVALSARALWAVIVELMRGEG
ncbi:hypothetical protein ACLF6K_38760 (plasmid) [Streptomyces xanthophaeus]